MVQGSQDCKNKTTHNQGTPQTPVAKKPLILNNDMVPTSTHQLHLTLELLIIISS